MKSTSILYAFHNQVWLHYLSLPSTITVISFPLPLNADVLRQRHRQELKSRRGRSSSRKTDCCCAIDSCRLWMLALLNYDQKDNDVEFSIGLTEAHPAKQQFDRARYCLCLAVAYIWLRWRRRNKCECHDDSILYEVLYTSRCSANKRGKESISEFVIFNLRNSVLMKT
jgi:hypothetical protein